MPSILIVGAGIAGLAAACAVKPYASKVTVLERSQQLGEIGAAIQMKPNATRWLPLLGVDMQALRGVDVRRVSQFNVKDSTEDEAPSMDQPIAATKMFGSPWVLTHRADLHKELLRAATTRTSGADVTVITGVLVDGLDADKGVVTASDGRQWQADIVIGADGIHSNVRDLLFPHSVQPRPADQAAYRCLVPASKITQPRLREILLEPSSAGMKVWLGEDRRIVTYPCRNLDFINIVAIFPDPALCPDAHEAAEAELDAETITLRHQWPKSCKRESTVEELLADFSTFPAHIRDMLSASESPSLWQLQDLDPLPSWTAGRVLLIGDAAHAMLPHMGQGGSTSIEDAAALRAVLSGPEDGPLPEWTLEAVSHKLAQFEKLRLARIHTIQEYSRVQGQPKAEQSKGHHMNALQFSKFAFSDPGFAL